eukprot:SAG22_NODE_212_length_15072_cov_3.109197_19_plen_186_part_00
MLLSAISAMLNAVGNSPMPSAAADGPGGGEQVSLCFEVPPFLRRNRTAHLPAPNPLLQFNITVPPARCQLNSLSQVVELVLGFVLLDLNLQWTASPSSSSSSSSSTAAGSALGGGRRLSVTVGGHKVALDDHHHRDQLAGLLPSQLISLAFERFCNLVGLGAGGGTIQESHWPYCHLLTLLLRSY